MVEDIEFIDDSEQTIFSTFSGVAIANFFCHEIVRTYFDTYKQEWVPESFFEFMFDEFKKYAFLSSNDIREFFRLYKTENIASAITNYMNCEFSALNKKRTRGGETVYHIDTKLNVLHLSFANNEIYGSSDKVLYSSLKNTATHFSDSDELVTTKDLYERFLLKKQIKEIALNKISKNQSERKSTSSTPSKPEDEQKKPNENQVLVGEQSEVPNQKGKIVKMFFPKLNLPSAYPTSLGKSRVNSERTVNKFMKIDTQVSLINKYKFNGVKYNLSFINKRKLAQKPQKKKFDFDF